MKVLVTGAAGFIGYHTARRLLECGFDVMGIDNLNDYYAVSLKEARLSRLLQMPGFGFFKLDICDRAAVARLFREERPQHVVHLAAQAGVRYSLEHPQAYVDSNLVGFANILEGCRQGSVEHLVYASSSSVYGGNRSLPFSVADRVDCPVSLYAATKRANELMAYVYSQQFGLAATGLRLFTIYGPWGRPDMAPSLFTQAILEKRPIDVFNHGDMKRDFTYVDDAVEGIVRFLNHLPNGGERHRLYNIGNHRPVDLMHFIAVLEACLGQTTEKNLLPMQPGDMPETFADISDTEQAVGFAPDTPLEVGLRRFTDWYRSYYQC
jgi:UDP-glucuronate 4-epimerase